MNTIKYNDLKAWYLDNEGAKANAKLYFGDRQPSIWATGFYSSPSWNWGYHIGIVGVIGEGNFYTTEEGLIYGNGIDINTTKWFEVVTQFGAVKAAKAINLPEMRSK